MWCGAVVSLAQQVKSLGLLTGRGRQETLLELCDAGRLVGGLSIALTALPDEVVGALTHAMGASARAFRVVDVWSGPPMVLEIVAHGAHEKWEVNDVESLVHNLNDLYRDDVAVRWVVILGERSDMLQLWCVKPATLRKLLARRLLDDAPNAPALRRAIEPLT